MKYNKNFDLLGENYLFTEIRKRKKNYLNHHLNSNLIDLGVGDVRGGLPEHVINAIKNAANEYLDQATFHGYPPEQGYPFLREKIVSYYRRYGVKLDTDDIFISDGAKSDIGNILDLFPFTTALIPTPVYPAYVDTNILKGNKVKNVICDSDSNFCPSSKGVKIQPYLIYLCSPNNPTGAVYSKARLTEWVRFALRSKSIIIFDSAYESFIRDDSPHSIFEIEGSENCCIEIGSFSKRASFTGLRVGYSIIKRSAPLMTKLGELWKRRHATKFNGVSYIMQKAAESTLTPLGIDTCNSKIDEYLENAKLLKNAFTSLGFDVYGGQNAPYLWVDCKESSWQFFDYMLEKYQIIGTAGIGFGKGGETYYRLSAFANRKDILSATNRLKR